MSDKIELLHDNPLKFKQNDDKYEQDGLNFKTYTKVITNAILNTQTPFTVGIFGEWGKGKTSFLEIIKQKIEHDKYKDNNITVWFNAWQYEKEEHPIVPLLAVIIKALNDEKGEVRKGFEKFASVLRSVAYGFSVETTNKDVLGNELKMQLNSKDMIDRYEQLVASALLDKSLYFNAFEKLEALESLASNKIIVFIDDLDRCLPPNAIKLLESIKLVLSQKGFVFVLGVAKEVLEGHLNHKYEKEFGIEGGNHGKSYLEKMIQLPFTLPKFTQKVESLVDSLFSKIDNNGDNLENIKEVINAIATHSKVTPRLLVRIINQAKIHAEIDKELKNDKVYDDMYASFVFVSLLDTLYEEEYKILSVEIESRLKKIINLESLIEDLENDELTNEFKRLCKSIKDNKCLKNLLKTKLSIEWLKNKKLRDRTIEFVDISTDTSDEEIKKQEEIKLGNIRDEILAKCKRIKTDDDFKKLIFDGEDSYKTFIKINDEKENEFEISKFLVTNKWYDEYENTQRKKYGDNFEEPFNPVVGVSFMDAESFCDKLNKEDIYYIYSLLTKEEFEFVSSLGKDVKFPWGNTFDKTLCNNSLIGLRRPSVVGAFGFYNDIADLCGNVDTLTQSKKGNNYIIKGGSYRNDTEDYFYIKDDDEVAKYKERRDLGFYIKRVKKDIDEINKIKKIERENSDQVTKAMNALYS